jgi:hypothetical protein
MKIIMGTKKSYFGNTAVFTANYLKNSHSALYFLEGCLDEFSIPVDSIPRLQHK